MAKGEDRRAAIRRIADVRRVSYTTAKFIYECMSIPRKQALSDRERKRREAKTRLGTHDE